jgi:hypothetical protein
VAQFPQGFVVREQVYQVDFVLFFDLRVWHFFRIVFVVPQALLNIGTSLVQLPLL